MGLFGASKQKNPADQVNYIMIVVKVDNLITIQLTIYQVKEWNAKLRKEGYALDRQIRQIKREEDKIKKSLKEAAKKNDKQVCTIYAKEIVRTKKAVNRIYASKATLNSVQLQMSQQLGKNDNFHNSFKSIILINSHSNNKSLWIPPKVN